MNKTVSVIGQIETDVIEQIKNTAKYLLELKYNDFLPVQPGLQEGKEKIHISCQQPTWPMIGPGK